MAKVADERNTDVYKENGFMNREEYIEHLSDEYGVDIETISAISSMLGEYEDFDGLVMALEDYAQILM